MRSEAPERERHGGRSFDSLLGSAAERYFGSGYRDVRYSVQPDERASSSVVSGRATIVYPSRWSVSGDGEPRVPHLSSVDAVVVPMMLIEASTDAASRHDLSGLRVASVELRGGSKPWLSLDDVPIRAAVETHGEGTVITATVGSIRVRLHLIEAPVNGAVAAAGPVDVRPTIYGGLFQTSLSTSEIRRAQTLGELEGSHTIHSGDDGSAPGTGFEAAWWPATTVIDYLVVMGQLTQALVYDAASTARGQAGALWMRTMTIALEEPSGHLPIQFETVTRLLRDRVLDRGGQRLHDVEVESHSTSGVVARSTLAYRETST